jgi:hypothetical protein
VSKKLPIHFVHDGCERAYDGLVAQIRAEVVTEYSERLRSARWFQRWRIYREIRREVSRRLVANKRLDEITSPYNLYFSS